MSDAPKDTTSTRLETLSREAQAMRHALDGFTLMGVLDRDPNHIASMQDEIDLKTREALVVYWLSAKQGEIPQGEYLG
jgi:hypothetical protein